TGLESGAQLKFNSGNHRFTCSERTGCFAVAAGGSHGTVFHFVGKIAVEGDYLDKGGVIAVTDTAFPVGAGFGIFVCQTGSTERGKTFVNTGEYLPVTIKVISERNAGQPFAGIAGGGTVDNGTFEVGIAGFPAFHIFVT